jgi:hypothetical protein
VENHLAEALSIFSSRGQSFLSSFLATGLPIISLALPPRALFIAKTLATPFDLEEVTALSVFADSNFMRIKEFPPKNAVEQGANPEANVSVHRECIGESERGKHVREFTNDDSCINLWGQK